MPHKPNSKTPGEIDRDNAARYTRRFYRDVLTSLERANVPVLVGGAFAFSYYTGIQRPTKDFDLFIRRQHIDRALDTLAEAGFHTELTFPHWLAKAKSDEFLVDLIFGSGNGVAPVDDLWFEHAVQAEAVGVPVLICPAEELMWSKAFVMERERYDGADVTHLLHACAESLDWDRLSQRFGKHWRILFTHLTLFGFIYPSERRRIPEAVMRECMRLLDHEMRHASSRRICRGTLTSRAQYLVDLDLWGYEDARLAPHGSMSEEEASIWTAAIDPAASRPLGERPREADAPNDLPAGRVTHGSM